MQGIFTREEEITRLLAVYSVVIAVVVVKSAIFLSLSLEKRAKIGAKSHFSGFSIAVSIGSM